jgi:hypothetical protein
LCEALAGLYFGATDLNASSAGARFAIATFLGVSPLKEIDYFASHFYEIDRDVLKGLSHQCLNDILESEKLQLSSEDSLVDLILELGDEYLDLLGFVRCEYLTVSGIDRVLNTISVDEIDARLWESLCRRLRLLVRVSSFPDDRFGIRVTELESSLPWDGIIAELTRECGGNPHIKGILSITASASERNQCYQIADYLWNDYWYSADEANSWIQFDFMTRGIAPSHYTLKSDSNSGGHLVEWSLTGSNDGSWEILDQRDTQALNGQSIVKSYACKATPSPSAFYRFIRRTQNGPNSQGFHRLRLGNLEFFGRVTRTGLFSSERK